MGGAHALPARTRKHIVEQGRRKRLTPGPAIAQLARERQRTGSHRQFAVGIQDLLQLFGRKPLPCHRVKRGSKVREIGAPQAQPGRHGMSPKALDQAGMARIDGGQRIADMEAGNRACRAPQLPGCVRADRGERNYRSMQALLHPGRHQPDHSGMPARLVQHDTHGVGVLHRRHHPLGLGHH